jgi:hypothetical protein
MSWLRDSRLCVLGQPLVMEREADNKRWLPKNQVSTDPRETVYDHLEQKICPVVVPSHEPIVLCPLCGRPWEKQNNICCNPYVDHLSDDEIKNALVKYEGVVKRLMRELEERAFYEKQLIVTYAQSHEI